MQIHFFRHQFPFEKERRNMIIQVKTDSYRDNG